MQFVNYIKAILSAKSPESSKRLISLYSLVLLTVVIIAALCGVESPYMDTIIYALLSLILGSSAMTLLQNNSAISSTSTNSTTEETKTV